MNIWPRARWSENSLLSRFVAGITIALLSGLLTPVTASAAGSLNDCTIATPRLGGVSYYEFWLLDGSRFSCPGFSLSNWSAVARVKRNGTLVKEVNAGANQIYLTGLASGTDYTVSIVVTDETGASKEGEALSVKTAGLVDVTPPVVGDASPLQPSRGLAGTSFAAQFLVTDSSGVSEVNIQLVDKTGSNVVATGRASRIGGTSQNGSWSVTLSSPSSAQPNDFYNVQVRATDISGNTASSWVGVGTFTVVEPSAPSLRVGIYLISGRTSEIYGRIDGIADSPQQIQWVTCVESLSESLIYPKRDQIRYTYTVTGPAGLVASGSWDPNDYIDSQSSCTSNNGSGNMYTVAYNLTGLVPGTSYQVNVSGFTRSGTFSGSTTFKTQSVSTPNPVVGPTFPDSISAVIPETSTSPTTPVDTSTSSTSGSGTPSSGVTPTGTNQSGSSSGSGTPSSGVTPTGTNQSGSSSASTTPTTSRFDTQVAIPAITSETSSTSTSSPATTSSSTGVSSSNAANPTSSTPRPVAETNLEGQDEDPRGNLTVRRTENSRYRMSVTTNLESEEIVIRATKKGAKTIRFQVTLNEDGRAVIVTSRNLSGYRLVLFFGEDSLDSVRVN